jgi:hypothetical protein
MRSGILEIDRRIVDGGKTGALVLGLVAIPVGFVLIDIQRNGIGAGW